MFLAAMIWCIMSVNGDPSDFDCPMRQFLLEYAVYINPSISRNQLQDIADALNGDPLAIFYNCHVTPENILYNYQQQPQRYEQSRAAKQSLVNNVDDDDDNDDNVIYVSTLDGDDNLNHGLSISSPFKTIEKAINTARLLYGPNIFKQILIRHGTYYLSSTIHLNNLDSNLEISNYNNEYVNISGAIPLDNIEWKFYGNSRKNHGIYYTKINKTRLNINTIYGLRINGYRGIRARYPNVISEETFPPNTYTLSAKQWYLESGSNYTVYTNTDPDFTRSNNNPAVFTQYSLEINGSYFDKFVPPASAPRLDNGYPIGLEFDNDILPNAPYKNVSGGIVRAWEINHWYTWMWQLDSIKSDTSNLFFLHSGGNQGSDPATCDTFFIENIFEELDEINEWIYNDTQEILYFIPNITDNYNYSYNVSNIDITKLKVLIQFNGNQSNPIKNVTISGFRFIDTVYTYLDSHSNPPGGGWGVQYNGAINLFGTENVNIKNNIFSRLDGVGIFIFGYNRNTLITQNEFIWIGDSCIIALGNTIGYNYHFDYNYASNKQDSILGLGINGTNGNQPRELTISYNIGHEIGINEKQSSFYFQAISCSNSIYNNIVYNGPRAGILFNDGFGGNNSVNHNILFNLCRESSDHGPFNSWDHTPYLTKVRSGGYNESIIKSIDNIFNNFILSNFEADYGIDNDDCSQYFDNFNNFLVYGYWGFKNNFGGHDIHSKNNIYAYVQRCIQLYYTMPFEENKDILINNTCIINDTVSLNQIFDYAFIGPNFGQPNCNGIYPVNNGGWLAQNNTIMINNGSINNVGYCNVSLKQMQDVAKTDLGSIVQGWPDTQTILNKARHILWN